MPDPTTTETATLAVTERELAKALGVSQKTLSRWRASQGLPHVKVGKIILFRAAAIEKWLREREITATAEVARWA
jgi:excisionase family DNA binding protein